jgi:mRNA interferase MazF
MTIGENDMVFARGSVVLVPFPFTDLSAIRTRPAVVFSTEHYARSSGDLIIAMVTGQRHDLPTDYELRDWREAGLLAPSWVRAKLATIAETLIRFSPGTLTDRDLQSVETRIRAALALD